MYNMSAGRGLRFAIGLGICVFSYALFAQNPTGTLVGTVQDATGAIVPAAALRIRNTATNERRDAMSDRDGGFTIPNLVPGKYEATVSKDGFHTLIQQDIEVQLSQVVRLEFRLTVGAVMDTIEVQAMAPLLNTENGEKGDVMVKDEIMNMPLNGRDVTDLASLVPTVLPSAQGGSGGAFNINGARSYESNFLISGFNNTDFRIGGSYARANLDAVEEFKMQTSNFSAEYGRLAGGIMNMVLKSGGNLVHGSVFEFLRNDAIDARNFFSAGKPKLRQNQYGASLNGPIWIPKLYDGRNRTFFLFSWESLRQLAGTTQLGVVPTAAEKAGDFSRFPAIKDPVSNVNFPNNQIPVSRMSSQALKAQAFYPLPNNAGINNFLSVANNQRNWDSFNLKFDEVFDARNTLSYSFLRSYNDNITHTAIPELGNTVYSSPTLMGLSYTRLFSPNVINEARIGFTHWIDDEKGVHAGHDYSGEFGIKGTTTDPTLVGFPQFTISNYITLGEAPNLPIQTGTTNIQLRDTLTWVRRQHLFKFGGEMLVIRFISTAFPNSSPRGQYTFLGRATNQPYADFLTGVPETASRTTGKPRSYLYSKSYSWFAQDDWKLSSRVTLNLGIRHEIVTPAYDKFNRLDNFVPELNKLVVADFAPIREIGATLSNAKNIVAAEDVGLPKTLAYTRYNNFAPRVGLAWRPFGGNRTVLRGGYGLFYGSYQTVDTFQSMANVYPFTISQSVVRNALTATLADPFGSLTSVTGDTTNARGYELHGKTPTTQSWNLTFERQIGTGTGIEIAYTGSKGTHLPRNIDINQPLRSAAAPAPPQAPRPFPDWGTINQTLFIANSNYNAGVATFRKRYNRGFFFSLNYTYSKSIDDSSQNRGNSFGGISGTQDSRNLALDRARSDWDRGHAFQMYFSYEVPAHQNIFLRRWQLAGTGRAFTGQALTPRLANVNVNLGQAPRPDRIAKGRLDDPTINRWFDVSAFPPVPNGGFRPGNSGRNVLDGPAFQSINLSLQRSFVAKERYRLRLRVEGFNVFNHTSFLLPITTVDTPTAGTITSANAARQVQMGLQLQF